MIRAHDEQLGRLIICSNCNTRQTVPPDSPLAPPLMPDQEPAEDLSRFRGPSTPYYGFMLLAGYLLMIAGAITSIVGLFMLTQNVAVGLIVIVNGPVTMGLGQLLHCVRDIGRNSWSHDLGGKPVSVHA